MNLERAYYPADTTSPVLEPTVGSALKTATARAPGATAMVEGVTGPAADRRRGELRYRWDPFVREQRLLDGAARPGKGVRTWTRARHGLVMVSEYVTYRPPTQVGMRMVKGPWFFRTFSGG